MIDNGRINSNVARFYGDEFYEFSESLNSARIYLTHLWTCLQPDSVLDVGCGRGAWLRACRELGSNRLFGLDGPWNNPSLMIDNSIEFRSIDLNQPFTLETKVDLAMSLEVAEHLVPSSSSNFVDCLADASDAILFSAAYPGQGGNNHINERPHTYWAELFAKRGCAPFDLFRPVFWGDQRVPFWYRQNVFLYLREGSEAYHNARNLGLSELLQTGFMNCVHPELYDLRCKDDISFMNHLRALIPSFLRAVKRRIGR